MADFRDTGPAGSFNFEGWVDAREREYAYTLESYAVDHEVSAQVIVDAHDEVLQPLLQAGHTTEELSEQLLNVSDHVTGELSDTYSRVDEFLGRTYANVADLVSYNDRKLLEAAAGELRLSGPRSVRTEAILWEASSPQDARLLSLAHDYSLWELLRETAEQKGVDHPDVGVALDATSGPEAARAMRAGLDHVAWRSHPAHFAYRPEGEEDPVMVPKPASGDDVRAAMVAGSGHSILQTVLDQAERLPLGTKVDVPESLLELARPLARLVIELQDLTGRKSDVEQNTLAPPAGLDIERLRALGAGGTQYLGLIGLTLRAMQAARLAHLDHLDYVAKTRRTPIDPEKMDRIQPYRPVGSVKLSLYEPSTLTVGFTSYERGETGSSEGKITEMTDKDD